MSTFSVGQLAQSTHTSISAIHFYEKHGLIPKAARRASGYRQYGPEDVRRMQFIRRAKELGFSLEEIRELLALKTASNNGVSRVKNVAQKKLHEVDHKITELRRLRKVLAELVEACPGKGNADHCPILSAFDDSSGVNI